jgi:hypothetical protein
VRHSSSRTASTFCTTPQSETGTVRATRVTKFHPHSPVAAALSAVLWPGSETEGTAAPAADHGTETSCASCRTRPERPRYAPSPTAATAPARQPCANHSCVKRLSRQALLTMHGPLTVLALSCQRSLHQFLSQKTYTQPCLVSNTHTHTQTNLKSLRVKTTGSCG